MTSKNKVSYSTLIGCKNIVFVYSLLTANQNRVCLFVLSERFRVIGTTFHARYIPVRVLANRLKELP